MRKRTLLSLLGAGLIYTGCGGGELNSDSSSCEKLDVISIQQDTAVDTYDTGIDTKKEVKVDTAYDSGKDTFGLETEVSTDAVGDTEEETNADVYQITLCPDLDKDGFFGTISGEDCYAPSGKDGDCNDKNKLIYPGALEICDGLDNNCNGLTDEDIPDQSYYTGAAETLGVGACTGG
ncbi:MAG: putative metal-binding motif-containing protein, partial [Nanoarchaeota archaeon]